MKTLLRFFTLLFTISFVGIYDAYGTVIKEKSLLWKISGNGLESPSYLFGTIHVICEDNFLMNEQIEAALKASDQLALEIDVTDPEMMANMQMLSVNQEMRNIKEDLNPEQIDTVNEYFTAKFGAGIDQLGILKPFVISSLLIQGSLPCSSAVSYENFLSETMNKDSKQVVGLETIEFQMSIFDKIPHKFQIDEIVKSITEKI
ncbi:TraB/GumN family protein [Arthrospiribacter ruber]|uniref:TraB/GumN family protein n=1 Tax=Arthrospiribacter ruber TaxID=2487934 RepID=A0A951IXZ8_9BACT|nr:TraB/GumN family protein [Arthrospiribacter ruber]MBW3467926.1 TraB/GumN family protein [Arthrospiribacter ruber]